MLALAKSLIYKGSRFCGVNAAILRSPWRTERLLILCYHGVSLADEHEWCGMYLSPETFRERLDRLKQAHCNVLPLGTAIELLRAGKLPPRAVVITFDDGFYDFYAKAWPLLKEFGYPATVYLTSYYSEYEMPVFDLACPYLLWKARGQQFGWPEMGIEPALLDGASALAAGERIKSICRGKRLDGPANTQVLRELAHRLGVDFDEFQRTRQLQIMTTAEAAGLAGEGVDFQLHGHWHRVSRLHPRFRDEIEQNRAAMARFGVEGCVHYCYPAGFHLPEFSGWLQELGVRSAVTCEMGLATAGSDPYALPRLVDSPGMSADEFSAWVSGLAAWIPRREYPSDPNQLIEEEVPRAAAALGQG